MSMTVSRAPDASPKQPSTWTWPVVLNVLAATGLVSALVSDGFGDVWSWIALGVPTAVMAWLAVRR